MIEAITEDAAAKEDVFRRADEVLPAGAILASNTSSIPITSLAAVTRRPEQVIGMHFFNPVPVLKLVEVIRAVQTSDETAAAIVELARELGKEPAEARDFPGFVSNRILMPFINEAAYALMEGVAEPEAIDTIAKLGFAHPMGPLALADLIGLDTCVAIMEVLHRGLGNPKYAPCPLLRQYVQAGRLGRKSGRGFYVLARRVSRERVRAPRRRRRRRASRCSLKSTAPFTSSTTQVPRSAGSRSTPTRSPPTAAAAAIAIAHASARRGDRLAPRAERDVRPPLARCGDAAHSADDAAARDDDAAGRSRAVRRASARSRRSPRTTVRLAGRRVSARSTRRRRSGHVLAPEPKRGLRTIGGSSSGSGSHGATCTVRGCGTPAANSAAAVASLSCAATSVRRPFRTVTPERREPVERPQPGLDAVERREHVEAAERDVAGAEPRQGLRGRRARSRAGCSSEWPMGDDGEGAHCGNVEAGRAPEGPAARPLPTVSAVTRGRPASISAAVNRCWFGNERRG